MNLEKYEAWRKRLASSQLRRWEELPELNLYIDQLIAVINDRCASLGVSPITKAMINNYVKKGVIMAPVKKKYSRYQVAAVMVIALLKNIYPLTAIKEALDQLTINDYPQATYNRFVEHFNALLLGETAPQGHVNPGNDELLRLAAQTAYQRMLATKLLEEMKRQQQPVEVKKV